MFSGLLSLLYEFVRSRDTEIVIYSSAPWGRLSSNCRVWGVDVVEQSYKIVSGLGSLFYSHVTIY